MVVKKAKPKNKVDQAIDIAFTAAHKESGIKPMDLFMCGMGYTGAGLSLVNTPWMPGSFKVLGGCMVFTGIMAMVLIARKL